jgi:Phenylalanyl-tRNA synthetase alpha subunit
MPARAGHSIFGENYKMMQEIHSIRETALIELSRLQDKQALEKFRLKYLSRRGIISQLFEKMKDLPKEEKPAVGKALNDLRSEIETNFENTLKQIEFKEIEKERE